MVGPDEGIGHRARRAEQGIIGAFEKQSRPRFLELGAIDFDKADIRLHLTGQCRVLRRRQGALGHVGGGHALDEHHGLARGLRTGGPEHETGGTGVERRQQNSVVATGLYISDFRITHGHPSDMHRHPHLLLQALVDLDRCRQPLDRCTPGVGRPGLRNQRGGTQPHAQHLLSYPHGTTAH
ncbi:hypothetical protein D9M71_445290 [compost metagenome]